METPRSWPEEALTSRYIRTSWMLIAEEPLAIAEVKARVYRVTEDEALVLINAFRNRSVYSRDSRENDFYVKRAERLAGATIIEVLSPGDPDAAIPYAEPLADLIERIVVLSSVLAVRRSSLHRTLSVGPHRDTTFDLVIDSNIQYLRSRSRPTRAPRGLSIDTTSRSRFLRCGFPILVVACSHEADLARRLTACLNWMFESRLEHVPDAAIVKSAIALETLLIADKNEPLGRTLSERAAFILGNSLDRRREVSRCVRRFYDARSAVVHGGKARSKVSLPTLIDGIDRLILLMCLTIAANAKTWPSTPTLQEWCEQQRWGTTPPGVTMPFPQQYLDRALKLIAKSWSG